MHSNKSIDCQRIKGELSAFLDKELDKDMMRKVGEHLKSCITCMNELNKLIKMKTMVRAIKRVEVDSELPLKIIDSIGEAKPSPEIAWFPVTIRVALLIAILLNIAIFNLFRDHRFKVPYIHLDKTIKVENVVLSEERGDVSVSFSAPLHDSLHNYIPPEIKSVIKPSYTEKLLNQNIEGTVVLNVVVDKVGDVESVKLVKPLFPEADSLAIVSVRSMKFNPAQIGTITVKSEVTTTFLFKL